MVCGLILLAMECANVAVAFLVIILAPYVVPLVLFRTWKWYRFFTLQPILFYTVTNGVVYFVYDYLNANVGCVNGDDKIDLIFLLYGYFGVMVIPNTILLVISGIYWYRIRLKRQTTIS